MSYFALPRPRVFGHRGAGGIAPENTLASFSLATVLGARYLELDVHGSRDGEIVVLHDATLDRTTDGHGPVRDETFAQLSRLDAGHSFTYDGRQFPYRGQGLRIPRLETVLEAFPGACFNIEIKQAEPAIIAEVLAVLERTRTSHRTLLAAEHDAIMQEIRAAASGRVVTSYSTGEVVEFIRRVTADDWSGYEPPGQALQIPPAFGDIELVTEASVVAAHRCGVEIHVWTINDRAEMHRLLALGVDGLMSDLPGLAVEAVASL